MTRTSRALIRIFATGLLAGLPLAATVAVLWWVVNLLLGLLGPSTMIGRALVRLGLGVSEWQWVGYAIGIGIVAAAVFTLGLLVETGLQRGLQRLVEALVRRIPVVRTIYDLAVKMVDLFARREGDGLQSMSPVWCHFGGPGGGAAVLGLLSSPVPVLLGGQPYHAVLVPTAPVPVGGGLLFVPVAWITPANIGAEAVTSIYVSMGVTTPDHLPRA